jgi:hypothetical protein
MPDSGDSHGGRRKSIAKDGRPRLWRLSSGPGCAAGFCGCPGPTGEFMSVPSFGAHAFRPIGTPWLTEGSPQGGRFPLTGAEACPTLQTKLSQECLRRGVLACSG